MIASPSLQIQIWPIDKLVFYARNPRKNDAAVDRMCSSIKEFGFKIPVLARSDGEVVDGHLRLKAARKLGITEVPVLRPPVPRRGRRLGADPIPVRTCVRSDHRTIHRVQAGSGPVS